MYYVFLPLAGPVIAFLLHIITVRLFLKKNLGNRSPQKIAFKSCVMAAFLCTILSLFNLNFSVFIEAVPTVLYVFSSSLCLCYWYFHIYNMSETARRIHILMGVYEDKIKNRSGLNKLSEYHPFEMVEVRIQRATEMGAAYEKDGKLYVNYGILFYAALFFSGLRKLLFSKVF